MVSLDRTLDLEGGTQGCGRGNSHGSLNLILLGLHFGMSAGDLGLLPLLDRVGLGVRKGRCRGSQMRLSAIAQGQISYT